MSAGNQESEEAAEGSHRDVDEDEQGPLAGVEHGVKDDEDEEDGNRQNQHQSSRRPLLALVLAGPVDLVAGGQLDLSVDFADGFFDGRAQVAVADTVLDSDVALATLAVDLFGAV